MSSPGIAHEPTFPACTGDVQFITANADTLFFKDYFTLGARLHQGRLSTRGKPSIVMK